MTLLLRAGFPGAEEGGRSNAAPGRVHCKTETDEYTKYDCFEPDTRAFESVTKSQLPNGLQRNYYNR